MLLFITDTGNAQLLHCFIGPESHANMQMSNGAALPLDTIFRQLDNSRPVLLFIQMVESEEDARASALRNFQECGSFVRHPPAEIFFPGRPPELFGARSFQGVSTAEERDGQAKPPPTPMCNFCHAKIPPGVEVGPKGECPSCAQINAELARGVAPDPEPSGAEKLSATARRALPALEHLRATGFNVAVAERDELEPDQIVVNLSSQIWGEIKPFFQK